MAKDSFQTPGSSPVSQPRPQLAHKRAVIGAQLIDQKRFERCQVKRREGEAGGGDLILAIRARTKDLEIAAELALQRS